ncbi:hypothetical protein LOZ12_003912 [Ophidiomyces ophidiicola]|uniref:Uncharacterized protein n=1 Tax=Ophidiomyces ophidiicola TaxID=1387563 RepID=A0ACB8V1X3_9EURO|nr:uncharacterized protein LOZ57_004353 [Ophidiomyces ophidiicola]KAI1945322.1 hypothetical protein LOZ57_004353 [Ophidiomyces ophidiicola]KAI1953522.1 hypothetical protein LOZ62_001079 [Ophidiomyces ophidiicola]KAI1971888.1 hypothetical protein LOZ56_002735 [Ophidiomyces ophidiicola]KAI1999737.1 hypothetical protein LOZ50_006532 [Ophidiomyces ophidiicola]KAI2024975.1 hypothetical protein LOZ48_005531 [Ophidiomyces ophidiicola]
MSKVDDKAIVAPVDDDDDEPDDWDKRIFSTGCAGKEPAGSTARVCFSTQTFNRQIDS